MTRGRPSFEEKVAFLRDRRSYRDCPAEVETIETHFAWVFLTARHAYKLKKPVRQAHMDYRTLASRERGCREEVRLNRRLARTVYQSVVPLSMRGGRLVLGKGEAVVDWLVRMRRLSAAGMLDHALVRGRVGRADLDRVVGKLVRFFRHAQPSPVEPARYIARLKREVRANRRVLRKYGTRLPQRLVSEVIDAQLELIGQAQPWLAARGESVVEGHGDLRVEHVHLGPPVAVIDCLEFDRELRLLDPAEEVALLALEIARLGHERLANELVRRFRAASAAPVTPVAFGFYQSHRAATRAKVAAWHLDDPQFPDPRPWIERTRSFLEDALRYAGEVLAAPLRCAGGRPALKQRHERGAREHASDGIPKERSNRKYGQSVTA